MEQVTEVTGVEGVAAPPDAAARLSPAERLPVADVPLERLQGLSLFEQFMAVWGTEERAALLWEEWYGPQTETGRGVLEMLVAQAVEEHGLTEGEARRRLAVEKYLNDRGADWIPKFMENYVSRQFQAARTFQPMAVRPKKKR